MYYLCIEMKHKVIRTEYCNREHCKNAVASFWAMGAEDIWLSKDGKVYFSLLDHPIW